MNSSAVPITIRREGVRCRSGQVALPDDRFAPHAPRGANDHGEADPFMHIADNRTEHHDPARERRGDRVFHLYRFQHHHRLPRFDGHAFDGLDRDHATIHWRALSRLGLR